MNRLVSRVLLFATMFFGIVIVLFSSESAYAIKNIPDGGAILPVGCCFPPQQNDVNPEVKKMWEENRIPRGGKNPALYSPTKGNNLVYDVYAGTTNQDKKSGFYLSPTRDIITFNGWAIIHGYHHHAQQNQATYIGLINKDNPKDRLIFKTAMHRINTSANSDVHDGQFSLCPSNAFNRPVVAGQRGACNMDYQYTQFRAFLNLRDIFTGLNEGKEWLMYIIKRVEDQIVYDTLVLPFDTESFQWGNGTVTMRSGDDARSLTMVGTDVIKRNTIGGVGPSGNQRYFAPGGVYRTNAVDDSPSNKVAVWYRVFDNVNRTVGGRTYVATNTNRWAASTFWEFGGSIATLKYSVEKANVLVKHVDANNNTLITQETIPGQKIGSNYTAKAKAKGVLKDSNGNPYVVIGENTQTQKVGMNTIFTFKYKASIPDPTDVDEGNGYTPGKAKGQFSWELNKINDSSNSRISIKNNFVITGNHFATRNMSYKTSSLGVFNQNSSGGHQFYENSPNALKNKDITYSFSYEYTNHFWENYKCVDKQGAECFKWEFVNTTPAWEYVQKAEFTKVLRVDHRYGETFTLNKGDSNNILITIGRMATVDGVPSSMTEKVYQEEYIMDRKDTKLPTQTWKDILELVKYRSDTNQMLYVIEGDKYYFPYDIEKNLQEKYKNKTSFVNYGRYAIPLKLGELKQSEAKFVSLHNFFITKKTGFIFSLPDTETNTARIDLLAKEEYEKNTNKEYNDSVLTSPAEGSRYYLNVDLKGEQKPNVKYKDNVVLGKLGLNDITVHMIQELEFEKYLFGHYKDSPIFVEQKSSVLPVNYQKTLSFTKGQISQLKQIEKNRNGNIHSFRATDDYDIFNKVKGIVPLN